MSGSHDKLAHFTLPVSFEGDPMSFSHSLSFVRKVGKTKLWVLHGGSEGYKNRDVLRAVFFGALMKPVLGELLTKVRMNADRKSYATEYIPNLKHDRDFSAYTKFSVDDLNRMRFPFICGALKAVGEVDFHGLNLGVSNGHFITYDTDYWGHFFEPTVDYAVYEPTVSSGVELTHRQFGINGDGHLGPHHWPDSRFHEYKKVSRQVQIHGRMYTEEGNACIIKAVSHEGPIRELYNHPEALFQQYEAMLATILLPATYVQAVQHKIVQDDSDFATSNTFNFMSHQKRLLAILLKSWRFCAMFMAQYEKFKSNLTQRFQDYNKTYEDATGALKAKYADSKLVLPVDMMMTKLSEIHEKCVLKAKEIASASSIDKSHAHTLDGLILYGAVLTCVNNLPLILRTPSYDMRQKDLQDFLNKIMKTLCVELQSTAKKNKFKTLASLSDFTRYFDQFMHVYQEVKIFLSDEMKRLYRKTCDHVVLGVFKSVRVDKSNIADAMTLATQYTDMYILGNVKRVMGAAWSYAFALKMLTVGMAQAEAQIEFNEVLPMLLIVYPCPVDDVIDKLLIARTSTSARYAFSSIKKPDDSMEKTLRLMIQLYQHTRLAPESDIVDLLEGAFMALPLTSLYELGFLRWVCENLKQLGVQVKNDSGMLRPFYQNSLKQLLECDSLDVFLIRINFYQGLVGSLLPMPTLAEMERLEAKFFELMAAIPFVVVSVRVLLEVFLKFNAFHQRLANTDKFTEGYFSKFDELSVEEQVADLSQYCRNFGLLEAYLAKPLSVEVVTELLDKLKPINAHEQPLIYQKAYANLNFIAQGNIDLLSKIEAHFNPDVCRPTSAAATDSSVSITSPSPSLLFLDSIKAHSVESALAHFGPVADDGECKYP